MKQPLRILFSETFTGEDYWIDVDTEFNVCAVARVITGKLVGDEPDAPVAKPGIWVLDRDGSTACFIMHFDGCLVHGTVYTRFNPMYTPTGRNYR